VILKSFVKSEKMIKVTGNRLFHWFDTIENAGVKNNKCITSVEKFKKKRFKMQQKRSPSVNTVLLSLLSVL